MFGARPLKRLIQREVVDRIAEQVVRGNLLEGDHVFIDVDADGTYTCRVEKPLDLDLDALKDEAWAEAVGSRRLMGLMKR